MAIVYLSLGTNLGDKETNIRAAIEQIKKQIGEVTSLSAFYITDPWGFVSSHTFLNCALCVNTDLTPEQLLCTTQEIELNLGRMHKSVNGHYSDRLIDIDILLYDSVLMQKPELTLPHPQLSKRRFVLEPLAEIAPSLVCPGLKKTIKQLLEELE